LVLALVCFCDGAMHPPMPVLSDSFLRARLGRFNEEKSASRAERLGVLPALLHLTQAIEQRAVFALRIPK
jgi:hypothetical protein